MRPGWFLVNYAISFLSLIPASLSLSHLLQTDPRAILMVDHINKQTKHSILNNERQ